jgi:predicted dithiol-disulfide oxidoreductase (DUF899 family)
MVVDIEGLRDGTSDSTSVASPAARGIDDLPGTYNLLDLTPLGRHEEGLPHTDERAEAIASAAKSV